VAGILPVTFSTACYAEVGPRIDADIPSYVARDSLSGRLTISVGDAMEPLVQAWADDLMRQYPELQIVVISERSHTSLTALLAQQTDMMALSRRMTPTEGGDCLLEFGDKPIAVPVAHHPQAVSVRNDDSTEYKTHPVTPLRVNGMVSDGFATLMRRSERITPPPFRGTVYLYSVNLQRANPIHASTELIRYALSWQGQQLALDLGYVPLSFEEVRRVISHWSASRR
jgi:ABC-type phosphate transport system substrate-binding protein